MRNEHHTARRGRDGMREGEVSINTARTSHISAPRVCCATHCPPCVHLRRSRETQSGTGWHQTHHKMTYPVQPPATIQRNTELRWQMRASRVLCGTGVRRDWQPGDANATCLTSATPAFTSRVAPKRDPAIHIREPPERVCLHHVQKDSLRTTHASPSKHRHNSGTFGTKIINRKK